MGHIIADRISENATTTGTGDITLAGALAGFRTFASVCSVGDTFHYVIEGVGADGGQSGEWECGLGTYSATNTLTRTTVSTSSNAGAAVNFAVGAKVVSLGAIAAARAPLIQTVTSSATVTPTFANDQVNITAQAVGLTLANPTGTAADAWGIAIRIKDNGTARSITFGSQYRAIGVTLPSTTVLSKTLYLGMIYNAADTKWDVVAVAQEA